MDIRPYRLYYCNAWKSYKSLYAAMWDLLVHLHSMNALELIDSWYFEQTYFLKKPYTKSFCVEVNIPYCKFTIKKMTAGNYDEYEVRSVLNDVKELFYKRLEGKE